jgi:CubicO group peptidase (beta-lactamase class C family)
VDPENVMSYFRILCVFVLVSSVPTAAAGAQPARFTDPDRRAKLATGFAEIDRLFTEFAERSHVPGAAWGVVVDGELVHSGATGVRELASKSRVDADTVFRIASMTKSVTALAVLKLRDEGRLSLEDPAEGLVWGRQSHRRFLPRRHPRHASSATSGRRFALLRERDGLYLDHSLGFERATH